MRCPRVPKVRQFNKVSKTLIFITNNLDLSKMLKKFIASEKIGRLKR